MKRLPLLLFAPLTLLLAAAFARPAPSPQFASGAVVGLAGTPHIWVADEAGILHWAGDTRALAGKSVSWATRLNLTLDQLRALRIGDPWLSAGLLKMGDPIYLVKWETDQASPTLLHIQSIQDVELFGINGGNYGQYVLEEAAWQERHQLAPRALPVATLQSAVAAAATPTPPATSTPAPTPTPAAPSYAARITAQQRLGTCSWETVVEVTGLKPGQRMTVSSTHEVYNCAGGGPDRRVSTATGFPGRDAGAADAGGVLRWRFEHSAFRSARYVFTDEAGHQVAVEQGSD